MGVGPGAVDWPSPMDDTQEEETIPPVYQTLPVAAHIRNRHRGDTGTVRSRARMAFDLVVTGSGSGGNAWVISPTTVHCGEHVDRETDWSIAGVPHAYTYMHNGNTETTSFILNWSH